MKTLAKLFALLLLLPALAQSEEPVVTAVPPTGLEEDDQLEPEVRIIKKDDAQIHEYRLNGQLYMVKIEPAIGVPYYIVDMDGDGELESRYNQIDPGLVVPMWMIYRW